ncbi:MAG: hypothetical protein M3N54_06295 [Acidobacteriota bacterium]|nr:hypothetical protein [Acidobacteriota bacterium]
MMLRTKLSPPLRVGIMLLTGQLFAQDAFPDRWQALHSAQPTAVSLVISAVKSDYYVGEPIPLQLSFTSTQANAYRAETRLQDRVGRLNGTEEFLVDPAAFTEDPLRGLPGETGGMGGLSGGDITLSGTPYTFEKLLNEWVRFREPGTYRIAILSRRVAPVADPRRVELVSNVITLNIAPAPAAWVKDRIAEADKVLDGPADPNEETRQRRLRAGETLRYLDSADAAVELARHLGPGTDVDSWALNLGVLGSPYRKQLLPLLEARLVASDQPVWGRYLDTLAQLAELASFGGPMRPFPADAPLQGAWRVESGQREAFRQGKRKEYVARLIASLPAKQPEARAVSSNTLIESASRNGGDASLLLSMAGLLIADFPNLPERMQINLLESRWDIMRSPAMLPALREIYERTQEPRPSPALTNLAVRRIFDLAPDEGRKIILSQIVEPGSRLMLATLQLLPDRSLPELNDKLVSRLEAGQFVDPLILRFATGDVVGPVEKAYLKRNQEQDRQNVPHCGSPLIYYFLQHDPAFGEREFRREMRTPGRSPVCHDIGSQFRTLDRNAYSPALERLAIEFLTSPEVPVKRGAAEVLGQYGSPAAEKPLWDTLEYSRSWWKGRERELDDPAAQEGAQFERSLRIALAQASGWKLEREGLDRLLELCSSNWCRREVKEWIAAGVPRSVAR